MLARTSIVRRTRPHPGLRPFYHFPVKPVVHLQIPAVDSMVQWSAQQVGTSFVHSA